MFISFKKLSSQKSVMVCSHYHYPKIASKFFYFKALFYHCSHSWRKKKNIHSISQIEHPIIVRGHRFSLFIIFHMRLTHHSKQQYNTVALHMFLQMNRSFTFFVRSRDDSTIFLFLKMKKNPNLPSEKLVCAIDKALTTTIFYAHFIYCFVVSLFAAFVLAFPLFPTSHYILSNTWCDAKVCCMVCYCLSSYILRSLPLWCGCMHNCIHSKNTEQIYLVYLNWESDNNCKAYTKERKQTHIEGHLHW